MVDAVAPSARVSAVLTWKQPRRWLTAVSIALAALVFTACMAQPTVQAEGQPLAAGSEPAVIQPANEEVSQAADTAESQPQSAEIEWLWPVPEYRYVSEWAGANEQNNTVHKGVDICAEQGTAILASADGVVAAAGWDVVEDGDGYCIRIDHGGGIETIYAHCHELFVEAGDEVTAGQTIAAVGSTGRSTGNHLHWELRIDGEKIPPQEVFPDQVA